MTTGQYLFFDTSALVKYFHEEPGSARVITLIEEDRRAVRISALARVEFVSAIHRKRREGLLSQAQLQQALSGFEEVLQTFHIDPLVPPVVEKVDALIRSYGAQKALRTLDALHLATFVLYAGADSPFVVADDRLYDVAQEEGIATIHPVRDEDADRDVQPE
jgi:predicted nucleic acid-binding protein